MFRPNVTLKFSAPVIAAVALVAGACGSSHPEQQPLQQFFRASSLGDSQTLANFAAVSFDAKTDGQVTKFNIVSVSEPRVEPLKIKELGEAVAAAEEADRAFSARKKEYQDAHVEALTRVLAAESANRRVTGGDVAVQTEWSKWRDETAVSAKAVSDARNALSDATPVPEMSLSTPSGPTPDLRQVEGTLETKDVTVDATVRQPDGSTTQKMLLVTMQRAVIKEAAGDKNGKWIFVAIKPA